MSLLPWYSTTARRTRGSRPPRMRNLLLLLLAGRVLAGINGASEHIFKHVRQQIPLSGLVGVKLVVDIASFLFKAWW